MSFNLIDKTLKHINYIIQNIKFIIFPIQLKFLKVDFNIILKFVLSDIKIQFLLKKKYSEKQNDHREFIKKKKISNDWFSENIIGIEHLINTEKLRDKNLNVLEIGTYQGNSTMYLLNNLKIKKITCVDTFKGSDEHKKSEFLHIYDDLISNTFEYKNKIQIEQSTSEVFFHKKNDNLYDLIYIDGSHNYDDVLNDAFKSYELLDKNGYLIFDDFLWKFYKEKNKNPINAIKFLIKEKKNLKIIFCSYQIILKKYV